MQGFDFDELFLKFRYPLLILLAGGILVTGGIFFFKTQVPSGTKVEILNDIKTATESARTITIEIAGEVESPGVYKLPDGSRVDDLLIVSGGFSAGADRVWTDKYLNRASKLTDGEKVYVPKQSNVLSAKTEGVDQSGSSLILSDSSNPININTASLSQLDTLPGIGPTYAQSIIEHRPYSTPTELVSKGAIKQSLFEKIKDKIAVY